MKGKLTLKVSDLLRTIGSDELTFDQEGMKGILELDAVDGTSVLVKVKDFCSQVDAVCDRCQAPFLRIIQVPEYAAKYTLDQEEFQESEEEVLLMIDAKNETIDLQELFYQVSHVEDPFVLRCPECERFLATQGEED